MIVENLLREIDKAGVQRLQLRRNLLQFPFGGDLTANLHQVRQECPQTAGLEKIFAASQLLEGLPGADYVLICAPETAETEHLIGAAEIAKMKRGARLINVGRGSLLDETALVQALESGTLGGAALDVAATEPLPAESPLWKAPNLFITPHTSGVSDRLWDRQAAILIELLERWFDGRELFNRVDFARGY